MQCRDAESCAEDECCLKKGTGSRRCAKLSSESDTCSTDELDGLYTKACPCIDPLECVTNDGGNIGRCERNMSGD